MSVVQQCLYYIEQDFILNTSCVYPEICFCSNTVYDMLISERLVTGSPIGTTLLGTDKSVVRLVSFVYVVKRVVQKMERKGSMHVVSLRRCTAGMESEVHVWTE